MRTDSCKLTLCPLAVRQPLRLRHDFWPKVMFCCVHLQIAEPINACSFAAGLSSRESGVGSAFGAFRGQMGCLYLFDDVLNPGRSTVTF